MRPFMFRRLGPGDVIGRSGVGAAGTVRVDVIVGALVLNEVEGKLFNGIKWTGESGEDDGEGSDRGEESDVDNVVVGEESADSDIWVDVLS
jgi:hypothetical protein